MASVDQAAETMETLCLEGSRFSPPIAGRLAAWTEVNPAALEALPPFSVIDDFARDGANGKGERPALSALIGVIENPDLVDAIICRSPAISDARGLLPAIQNWRTGCLAYLEGGDDVPTSIPDERAWWSYRIGVTPGRPGRKAVAETIADALRADVGLGMLTYEEQHDALCGMTPDAQTALSRAAELGLDLTKDDPTARRSVLEAIGRAVRSQEKWWILGMDPVDPLTRSLLDLLGKTDPGLAARYTMEMLFDKAHQDGPVVTALITDPKWELDAPWRLTDDVDRLTAQALRWDRSAVQAAIGRYIGSFGATFYLADYLLAKADVHDSTIEPGSDGSILYFGKRFRIPGLNKRPLREVSFGYVLGSHDDGAPALYDVDLRHYFGQEAASATLVPLEDVLYFGKPPQVMPSADAMLRFFHTLPGFMQHVRDLLPPGVSAEVFPIAAYYQLWDMLQKQPQMKSKIDRFFAVFGPAAIFSFLTGEFGKEHIEKIIDFSFMKQVPAAQQEGAHFTVRLGESLPEAMLRRYGKLALDAASWAQSITPVPEQAEAVRNLILVRAKALLVGAASVGATLKEDEQAYLAASFDFYQAFLAGLADPSGEVAKQLAVPWDAVNEYFRLRDTANPDTAAHFRSAFESWLIHYLTKQKHAPYAGRVSELTAKFYEQYLAIELDLTRTTVDPVLEKARAIASIEHDLASGILPQVATASQPVTVGFAAIGEARVEKAVWKALREKEGYRFVGFDMYEPAKKLPGVDYRVASIGQIGDILPKAFDRLYFFGSPLMDVLELSEWIRVVQSIAKSLKVGGVAEIDQALPFGKHSYQTARRAYHLRHPSEPEGMMARTFRVGESGRVGKQFFAPDPQFMIGLFEYFGLECTNLPKDPQELARLLAAIEADDTVLSGEHRSGDLTQSACYQTAHGNQYNRVTYKFQKRRDVDVSSADAVLLAMAVKNPAED